MISKLDREYSNWHVVAVTWEWQLFHSYQRALEKTCQWCQEIDIMHISYCLTSPNLQCQWYSITNSDFTMAITRRLTFCQFLRILIISYLSVIAWSQWKNAAYLQYNLHRSNSCSRLCLEGVKLPAEKRNQCVKMEIVKTYFNEKSTK